MSLAQLETAPKPALSGLLSLLQQSALLRSFSQTVLGLTRWLGLMSADSAVSPAGQSRTSGPSMTSSDPGRVALVLLREVSWAEPWLLDPTQQ